jgi:hypothetical protein
MKLTPSVLSADTATELARWLHAVPRLQFAPRVEWAAAARVSIDDRSMYWKQIIATSLCPLALGFCLFVLLLLWATCRATCCCKTSRKCRKQTYKCTRNTTFFFLFSAVFCGLLGTPGTIFVDNGFSQIKQSAVRATNILIPAQSIATRAVALEKSMLDNLDSVQHCIWPEAEKEMERMKKESQAYGETVKNIAQSTDDTITFILDLEIPKKIDGLKLLRRVAVGLPLAFLFFVSLCACLSIRFASSCGLKVTFVYLVALAFFLLLGAAAFEIGAALILGDFCVDPETMALDIGASTIGKDSLVYKEMSFYLKCEGSNPVSSDILSANATLLAMRQKLDLWTQYCDVDPDPAVTNLQGEISEAIWQLDQVRELVKCEGLHSIWKEVVREGVCDSALSGFSVLAVSQIVCAFPWLFFCTLSASMLWKRLKYATPRASDVSAEYHVLDETPINTNDSVSVPIPQQQDAWADIGDSAIRVQT